MKLRSLLMFLGCLLGGVGGLGYSAISGKFEIGSDLFSIVLYGIFIGLFFADFLSQGMSRKEA
jgi:hypothetical protein